MTQAELFLQAVTAYKAWIECGKDFVLHEDLWNVWDDAVSAYAAESYMKRFQAVIQIRDVLGLRYNQ